MPEIGGIPYEAAEDLNKYLYDNYYSIENLDSTLLVTGYLNNKIFELELGTGGTANSSSMINYDLNYFNPLYGEAVWKCYMVDEDDCFVFFGFKETTAVPTFDMVESHSGFMVDEGKLYASVANGDTQQRVEIIGIDLTRVQNYKIGYFNFYIQPLPITEVTLGIPGILTTFPEIERVWKLITTLSNFPPINQVHYIVQYIKNVVNANKIIKFNRFIYKEVYAD